MEPLIEELKILIVDTLELEDLSPEDIDSAAPLFGDGLGLDSIDALELGVELQKRYGLKIEDATEEVRQHFYSVKSLATFVAAKRSS